MTRTAEASVSAPGLMSFQGYLTDANGNPLTTNNTPKNYDLLFRLWDLPTGGATNSVNELYAERQTATVNNGYFSVQLGQGVQYNGEPWNPGNLPSCFFTNGTSGNSGRYLETTILGVGPNNGNITIAPRMACLSTPYAFMAANANNAVNLVNAAGTPLITSSNTAISVAGTISGYGTIPIGCIVMWSGTNVPAGWALCDGTVQNGLQTPDLRGRFIVGTGSGIGLTARTAGQTGGSELHTNTVAEMAPHAHAVTDPGHTHGLTMPIHSNESGGWNSGAYQATDRGVSYWGNNYGYINSATTGITVNPNGTGTPYSTLPPYYALAFIMRVQ